MEANPTSNPYSGLPDQRPLTERIYDRRATGLTGELIDGLLRAEFTKGVSAAGRDATENYEAVWQQGYEAAVNEQAPPPAVDVDALKERQRIMLEQIGEIRSDVDEGVDPAAIGEAGQNALAALHRNLEEMLDGSES